MEMSRRERAEIYNKNYWRLPKDIPFCINCEYFCRHYIKGGPPIFTISMVLLNCGHCVLSRVKDRKAYDTCANFKRKCK